MRALTTPLLLLLALPATAQVTVDGDISGDGYGTARAIQTVQTGFGDNLSELNAAYAKVEDGRLYLALTGNLEANFNKLEIFIDTVPGGENVLSGLPGNDASDNMAGLRFDAGFTADHHLIVRRGFVGTELLDLDISVLGTASFSQHLDILGGSFEGSGVTGTGPANSSPIQIGYSNANTAGIQAGAGIADQAAALAVTTGLELGIDLADLGFPSDGIRICAFVNNAGHNYASNQFLAGLAAPQGNLGGDGNGNYTGTLADIDLAALAGDQFFTVAAGSLGDNHCIAAVNSTGSGAVIAATGSTSVSANDLLLRAEPVPAGQFGVFFYGPGQAQVAFGNGYRCVAGSGVGLFRLPITAASGGQVLTWAVDNTAAPGGAGQLTAGSTWNFQAWFRDPAAGGTAFNLSDGVELTFAP